MAYDIGPKIGIEGEAEFRQAIRNINTNIKTLGTEMLAVTSAYDANDKSAAALTSRNAVLVKQIEAQKEKLEQLKAGLAASAEKYGENDSTTQKWQQTVNVATAELNRLEQQLQENNRELAGNTDKTKGNTSKMEDQVSVLDRLSAGFSAMAKATAAAVGAATAAVTAFAKASIDTGMQFDSSMSQVAATMGTTVDKIGELREFAMEMGASTAFSANEAAQALNYMALAGYDASTSMDMLPTVLNLAAAGSIDLASASDMVTDAASALGLSIDETAEMVDKMAQASSKSNTSVAQLGEAILQIGGTAKNMAGGTTELSTALGILADNGIKGAEGGTHLRNVIMSLSSPTDKAAKTLKSLQVEVNDAAGNMRPLNESLGDLKNAISGMTQAEQTDIINTIFNKTDIAAVNALLANTGERWDELTGYIDDAKDAAANMANTQLDNLAGDITLFKSALEGAQIVLSDQLAPNFREFVQFASDGISSIANAFQEGGLTGAMETFGTVLSDGLEMIIAQLPMVVDASMQLLGALGQGLLDNLPTIADAALQVTSMLAESMLSALPEMASAAVEIITSIGEGFKNGLPQLAEGAVNIMTELGQYLQNNLPTLIQFGLEAISSFTGALRENAGLVIDGAIELAKSLAQGLADSIPTIVENVPTIVSNIANVINDNAPKILKAGVEIISTLIKGLINAIPTIIANMPKIIAAVWDTITAVNWINLGGSIVKGISGGISNMVSSAKNAIGTIKNALKDGIQALPEAFKTIGKNMIQGLINGIKGMASSAVKSAKELATSVVSGVKSFLGINSPSKLFREEIGQYISLGVAEGISDTSNKAVKSADKLAKDVYSRSKDWADKQTKYMELTYDEQIDLWETIQSQFVSSSKQYSDAEEKIFDLRQKKLKESAEAEKAIMTELNGWVGDMEHSMFLDEKNGKATMEDTIAAYRTMQERVHETAEEYRNLNYAENSDEIQKLQKLWWNYEDAITKQQENALKERTEAQKTFVSNMEAIQKDLEALQNGYLKELSKRTEEIANSYKLFDKVADRQEVDGQELVANLAGQISSIREFYRGLDTLENRGVGDGLVAEIRKMGVGASDQLDALLNLTDRQLSQYAALYEEKQRLAGELAERELRESREAMEKDLQKSLASMNELMTAQGPEMGKAFADGIAKGLRDGLAGVTEAAISVAEAAVTATKNSMGIASPSKVFTKLGGFMADGLSVGFSGEMSAVQRSIRRSMSELAGNAVGTVAAPASGTGVAGSGGGFGSGDVVTALQQALDGMDVYLDGRRVGQLVAGWQNNDNKAWGR